MQGSLNFKSSRNIAVNVSMIGINVCRQIHKVVGLLFAWYSSLMVCDAQNGTALDLDSLENYATYGPVEVYKVSWTSNSSLWILIVSLGGVIVAVIIVIAVNVCRSTICRNRSPSPSPTSNLLDQSNLFELQEMGIDHDLVEEQELTQEVDLPPSYSKCVRTGMITSTSSFLSRIWGGESSSTLPDYDTAVKRRAYYKENTLEEEEETGVDFDLSDDESGINIQIETDNDGETERHVPNETTVVVHVHGHT